MKQREPPWPRAAVWLPVVAEPAAGLLVRGHLAAEPAGPYLSGAVLPCQPTAAHYRFISVKAE